MDYITFIGLDETLLMGSSITIKLKLWRGPYEKDIGQDVDSKQCFYHAKLQEVGTKYLEKKLPHEELFKLDIFICSYLLESKVVIWALGACQLNKTLYEKMINLEVLSNCECNK